MKKQKFTLSKLLWLFMVLANVLFANSSSADTFTTKSSGSWKVASSWNNNAVPSAGDDVVLSHYMSIDSDITCKTLNVSKGGRLTVSAGVRVTVSGLLTLNGSGIEMLTTESSTSSLIFSSITGTGIFSYLRNMSGTLDSRKYWHTVSPPGNDCYAGLWNLERNSDESLFAIADYDESINKWNYRSSKAVTLSAGKGYTISPLASGEVKMDVYPVTGTVSTTINHSSVGTEPYGGWGWNAIGNPFTSAISVSSFYSTNSGQLDSTYGGLYIWDPETQGYNVLTQGTGDYVQMGQGFVVRSKTGGGTVNFTYSMRAHSPSTPYKSANILASNQQDVEVPKFVLKAETGTITRKTSFVFLPDMTTGLDPYYDAGLLASGGGMDIYSRLIDDKGVNFGLQALPVSGFKELVLPIMMDLDAASTVTFSPDFIYLPQGYSVKLEDKVTGSLTLLSHENAKYSVSLPANTVGLKRFYLHISNLTTETIETASKDKLSVYAADKRINIIGSISSQAKAYLYNVSGVLVGAYDLENSLTNVISADKFNSGMYLIQIVEGNKQKYTGKIILN